MRIVFVDTETTGLTSMDQVLEYSFKVWEDGVVSQAYTRRVMPTVPCNPKAQEVNGFTREAWEACGAVPWSALDCDYVSYFLQDGTIVGGHNTPFDVGMIAREFERAKRPFPQLSREEVDTKRLAVPLMALGEIPKTALTTVAQYFGLDVSLAHTSMGDVDMTIGIWERFLQLQHRGLRAPDLNQIPWPSGR
jgi:DNA polymerase III epsilon subunit-like protein